ncbi:calcineurin-like phosphoesterase family protein, partial [Chlamydia psittaci 06-1683]
DKMKNRKNCVERLEAFFTNFFCNGTKYLWSIGYFAVRKITSGFRHSYKLFHPHLSLLLFFENQSLIP